jgi:hypothetical protein
MSVAEIKEELQRMNAAQRQEIARALLELSGQDKASPQPAGDFAEAKAHVFDHYGELLKRLAQ